MSRKYVAIKHKFTSLHLSYLLALVERVTSREQKYSTSFTPLRTPLQTVFAQHGTPAVGKRRDTKCCRCGGAGGKLVLGVRPPFQWSPCGTLQQREDKYCLKSGIVRPVSSNCRAGLCCHKLSLRLACVLSAVFLADASVFFFSLALTLRTSKVTVFIL